MAKPKVTMKQYEKSAADRRADQNGAHGKEGSAKDMRMDRNALAAMNKRKK